MERTRNIPALLAFSVFAAVVPVVGESLAEDAFAAPSIARMARLPVGGLQAVETTDGDLLFLSDNGRYVFRGAAVDLWHGTKLTEFEVVQRLAGRIDLERLHLDVGELGAIDLGEGPQFVIFVDPFCPHCKAMFADLPALSEHYRIRLVPLPALGEPSRKAVLALDCASATHLTLAREVLLGARPYSDLPVPTGECGQASAQRALISAQILGIQGTPFLIAPDGRARQGRPDDLAVWLAAGEAAP